MQLSKSFKFKKWQAKKILNFKRVWSKGNKLLIFGFFGLRARSFGIISAKQLETIRIVISRVVQQRGLLKSWFHIFPHVPITKKPKSVRMGKGKGAVRHWVSPVHCGLIFLELGNIDVNLAKKAFNLAQKKLSFLTDIVIR